MISKILDLLTPRFMSEIVVMEEVAPDEYEIFCGLEYYDFSEGLPEYVAKVKFFNFFGFAFFPKLDSDIILFRNFVENNKKS